VDGVHEGKLKTGIIILSLFLAAALYGAPCGIHGSAQPGTREYVLNVFKNRSQAPSTINPSITLEALAQGTRFENTEAVSIIGYVALVKSGGAETCNCGATDAAHTDTHIALVKDLANANDKSKHIVVEVTPRTRRRYHLPSTATFKKQILHKRVMISGWLLYDFMHEGNAANTNPNGQRIWRLTCEEIHPVTGIKVLH
jgi:hypothetical protein